MKRALTPDQQSAVEAVQGDLAISAGAGSGKTTVLSRRFVSGMLEHAQGAWVPASIDQILTITFTKKAAGEIAERVRRELGEELSATVARRIDEAWISTIHRLCGRLVRRHVLEAGVEPGFGQADQVEAELLMSRAFESAASALYESDDGVSELLEAYPYREVKSGILGLHARIRAMGLDPSDARVPSGADELESALLHVVNCAENLAEALEECNPTPAVVRNRDEARSHSSALAACAHDETPNCAALQEAVRGYSVKGIRDDRAKELQALVEEAHRNLSCVLAGSQGESILHGFERLLGEFDIRYRLAKKARGLLDFDDLQEGAARLFSQNPEIARVYREHFSMIMVDEFQDTNEMQMQVLDHLRRDDFCVVGDERQSIYGFRYADVGIFERVRSASANCVELDQNFRSHEQILSFVNGVFSRPELFGPNFMQLQPGRTGGWKVSLAEGASRVECILIDSSDADVKIGQARREEARCIAERVSRLLESGTAPGDIAVLVRSATNVPLYASALERAGHAVYVGAGQLFFDAPEITEMLALLRAIALPSDDEAVALVLASRLVRLSDDALFGLRESVGAKGRLFDALAAVAHGAESAARLPSIDAPAAVNAYRSISDLRRLQAELSLAEMVVQAAERFDFDLTLLASGPTGVRGWANVLKLARFAMAFEHADSADIGSFVEHMRLRQDGADREGAAATGAGSEAIRILTIHGSKGLEFPVVFVADLSGKATHAANPFLVQAHDSPAGRCPVVGLKLPKVAPYNGVATLQHVRFAEELRAREVEEEKRCLYVACTRAEELLIISGARALEKDPGNDYLIDWIRSALEDPQADGLVQVAGCAVSVRVLRSEPCGQEDAPIETPDRGAPIFAPSPETPQVQAEGRSPGSISYTAMHRFEACPYAYYVRYVLGVRDPQPDQTSESAGFGVALHQALQGITGGQDRGTALEAVNGRHSLTQGQRQRLERAVDAFMGSEVAIRALSGQRIAREQPMRVSLGETSLTGAIDLISWKGDVATVVDYKTGQSPEADASRLPAYKLQAECYALGAVRAGATAVSVSFVFVDHDAYTLAFEFDARDAGRIAAEIEARLELIRDGAFPHLEAFEAAACSDCPALGGICPIDFPKGR